MRRTNRLASRLALALSLVAAATGGNLRPAFAQSSSVCTVVKLTLGQTAALEREAFKAQLVLTNNQADAPLSSLSVTISIKDANGNPVNGLFFNKVTDLSGVTAVDGSGTMQPASQATINWLIIPSTGAGGTSVSGTNYNVSAQISYVAGGVPSTNATQDAGITVFPQPLLSLEYALPFEVFGVDPFTLTGTTEPFPLGLRVTNVGAGTANNFQVTSAQPTITDNKQGLPISFQIQGTFVGSNHLSENTLTIPFGNVAPGVTSLAAWDMTSSYSGRFIDFAVTFTHAAELGGALTSLIQGVTTYTLIKDVVDDQPGHDAQFDLLVNTTTPRSQMEAGYQNNQEPQPDALMESDRPGLIPVTNLPAHVTGGFSGSNGVLTFAFDQAEPPNTWVHASIPFPQGGTVGLVSVARADGKVLNPRNAWIAKHIDKLTNTRTYYLHVLDYSSTQPESYGMAFNASSLDLPPDPISNLTASAAGPGSLSLNWNATGEDGSTGTVIGGRYAIFASTDPAAVPSVAASSITFSTTTSALAAQSYALNGLLGNATYQLAVFIADAAGHYAPASNVAQAGTLAVPPVVLATNVAASGFALSWETAANAPGAQYRLQVATVPGTGAADTGYITDASSAVFSGLSPNLSYVATALMKTSAGVPTPPATVATVTTLATPPVVAAASFLAISSASLTVQWQAGADPPDTEFLAELSTAPGQTPPTFSSGWLRSSSFAFVALSAQTTYYARAKARSRAQIETAYTDLGAGRTSAFSILPQSGAAGSAFALSGSNFGPFAGANTRVRFGAGGETASVLTWNSARITGTVPANLSTGTYTVLVERQSGNSITTIVGGTFAVLTAAPLTGMTLALSPADGDLVITSTPMIIASYAAALGVDTTSVHLALDGAAVPALVTASSASFVPATALSEGTHTVTASVADLGANVTTANSTFLVDTITPATSLQVGGLTASATGLTVVSTDTLGLAASDAGSGIADTVYLLDVDPNSCDFSSYVSTAPAGTCANPYYAGTFALSTGAHTLAFYSDDDAGNSEDYHHVAISVLSPVYSAASSDGVATLLSPLSGETVAAVTASSQVVAAAASQHLTAATSSYDLSPSGVQFNPAATLRFQFDPRALSTSTLAIYTFNGVVWDSAAIAGQSLTVLSSASVQLSGSLAHASLYQVFSLNPAAPTVVSISPNTGGNNGAVNVTVTGTDFQNGALFELQRLAAAPGFSATGGFPSFIAGGQAVRLLNGKVLYVGGSGASSVLATAYLYDPAAKTWTQTGSLSAPRQHHRAVLLQNGKVMVVGGTSAGAGIHPLATVELYDPASGTWSATGSLNWAREFPMAVALADGRVLVAGGTSDVEFAVSNAEIYDPASGVWSYAGTPSVAHTWPQGVLLQNGKVLMAGGRNGSGNFTADVELFNPANASWSTTGSLSGGKLNFIMSVLTDGRVLVAGGDNGQYLTTAELYDPTAGTWSATGSMTKIHVGAAAVNLKNGNVMVVGGSNGQGVEVQTVDVYDPAGGAWSSPGTVPATYFNNTATLLNDGSVLIAGGMDASSAGAYLYSPLSFDIFAASVSFVNATQLTGTLNLTGQAAGLWNVVVSNPDSSSGTLTNGFTIHDTVPPGAVGDLALTSVTASSATLRWTAPSSPSGALAGYDLRRATFPITASNFASATPVATPAPGAAGTVETAGMPGLTDPTFFAALRSQDIYGNVSAVSNVASLIRSTVTADGAPELTFYAGQPLTAALLSSMTAPGSTALAAATSQQLTLASSLYDLGPEGVPLVPSATLTFRYSLSALSSLGLAPADMKIYQFVPGTGMVAASSQTLDTAGQTVTASVPSLSSIFGLYGPMTPPAVTAISPATGANNQTVNVTVSGANFASGASFLLRQASGSPGINRTGGFPSFVAGGQAVRLLNGKVLYLGGSGASSVLATAYLYDPVAGTWVQTGSMSVPRQHHRAVLLQNGKVMVVGGTSAGAGIHPLATVELYDPASGTWSATGSLNWAREFPMAVTLADGRVLVAGGSSDVEFAVSNAEIYDPATGVWSYAGTPSVAHTWPQGVLLQSGEVLMAGGRNGSGNFTADVELFNPANTSWSTTGSLSGGKLNFTMSLLADGRVLVSGGDNGQYLATAEVYDPAAGTWSPTGSMTAVHVGAAAATLKSGKVLVAGGSNGQGAEVQTVDLYDPAGGAWVSVGTVPAAYFNNTATLLNSGLVLIAGGIDATSTGAFLYGPASFDIVASSVNVLGPAQMTGALNLTGQPLGLWSIIASNPNGLSGALPNAFTIHDTVAPSAVGDLLMSAVYASSTTLRWTAPASPSGALAAYDIRRSSVPITAANFDSAAPVAAPAPAAAGTIQTASISGIVDPTLFVAMKSQDVYGNLSALGNVASLVRSTVTVAGAPELSFFGNQPLTEALVSTTSSAGSVVLASASAQGLLQVSSIYDLGPEGGSFNPAASLVFHYSTETLAALGVSAEDLKIYEFFPGIGLVAVSSQTLDVTAQSVTVPIVSLASRFALFAPAPDRTPPSSALALQGVAFTGASGQLFVTTSTTIGFTAVDPASGPVHASGVARTLYAVDSATFTTFTTTFTLVSQGTHTLQFYSIDNAGNAEVAQSTQVFVDSTPPLTALQIDGLTAAATSLTLISTDSVGLAALDAGAGLARTLFALDGGSQTLFVSTFSLAPGAHNLAFGAVDNVGNVEAFRTIFLNVLQIDTAPPSIALTPVDGSTVTTAAPHIVANYADAGRGVDPASVRLVLDGIDVTTQSVVTAASATFVSSALSQGPHTASAQVVDFAGNRSSASATFIIDSIPPVTTLVVGSPQYSSGTLYIAAGTPLGFTSSKPAVTSYSIDGGSYAVFAATFTLGTPGAHAISYYSTDNVGNAETPRASTVTVDDAAPATQLQVNGAAAVASSLIVISTDVLSLAASDAGSGVQATLVALNGAPQSVYASTFSLAAGTYTLAFQSRDHVDNLEPLRTVALTVRPYDVTPPSLALAPVNGSTLTITTPLITASYADAGTGVNAGAFRWTLDGIDVTTESAVTASSAAFTPTAPLAQGVHTVSAVVADVAGNPAAASSTFFIDSVPPATTLLVDGLAEGATSLVIISSDTVGFSSQDAGSGIFQTLYALDDSGISVFVSSFNVSVGTHTLAYHSVDAAGNAEPVKTVFLTVLVLDTVAPSIALAPADGSTVTVASPSIVASYSDAGRGVDAASVRLALDGVDVTTQSVITAASATFTPGAALSQGLHTAAVQVADYAGNRSSATSTFAIDSIPPATTLVVGAPQFSSGTLFIAPATPLGFTSSKPAGTFYTIDDGSFTVFTATFAIPSSGTHVIRYFSTDHSGNVETLRASTVTVDAAPPATALLVNGATPPSISQVLVSTDVLSFQATDAGSGVQATLEALDGAAPSVDLSTFTLSAGTHTLAFQSRDNVDNLETLRSVALSVRAYDVIPPSLALTPAAGSTATTVTPLIAAVYADSVTGIDAASVRLAVDGVNVTTLAVVTASSATFLPPVSLAQGTHTVTASVADFAGNVSALASSFFIDSIPPVTAVLLNGLPAGATSFVATSTDAFGFAASDAGTGVSQTLYALDNGTETVFLSTFSLAGGTHTLAFHSRDGVGNLEDIRASFVTLRSTVTPVPSVGLIFPSPSALLVEQTLGGVVNVRGTVDDPNLQSWTLSVASGTGAAGGFATLASGAANASGQLAAWNTSSLAGPYTLKLSAKNAAGGVAVSTASVFIGAPAIGFSIGRRDSDATIRDFKSPQAIVARPDGLLWVALDDDGRVLLLSSSGTVVTAIGGDRRFKHPRGLALDAGENLYVADRDHDRVAMLSPDGSQLLAEYKGGLDDPNDVAVDADSSVYVADTGNSRVRVFSPSGTVLRDIPVGAAHPASRPYGVALSTEGVWVSDQAQRAAYLFTRQGVLLKTLAGIGRVRGDAVDHVQAFYVVDRTKDLVSKYDPEGSPLLDFGPRKSASPADREAVKFLSDPTDAAVAPDGSLWVVDSGHDRIVRYVLPSGASVSAAARYGVSALSVAGPAASPSASKAPAARNVDALDGGKVERDDGTGVRVPASALADSLELTVESALAGRDADAKRRRRLLDKIQPASEEIQYGPEGTAFSVPVTLTLSYDPAQVALQGLDEDQLQVRYWNPTLGDWQALDSVVDKNAKTVSAQTTHFSVYQVMGAGGSGIGVAAADATFGLKAAYVFPNPVRGTNAVTIRIQPGLADSVEVRVYDLSGRKVHSSSAFSGPTSLDDGNGLGAQFTYDHVWDVSGVGSGVYTYVITAHKAGNSDIHKTGRIGVIK